MNDDALILAELRRLRADVALLLTRAGLDARLRAFLAEVHSFARGGTWTAGELLQDARRTNRRGLLAVVEDICGERGDGAKRLGRWLERHAGAAAGEFRLRRVKREAGSWLYAVELED